MINAFATTSFPSVSREYQLHLAPCFLEEHTCSSSRCELNREDEIKSDKHQRAEKREILGPFSFSTLPQHVNRRQIITQSSMFITAILQCIISPKLSYAEESILIPRGEVFEIQDPNSYSAVVYIPPSVKGGKEKAKPSPSLPLLIVLHGAGVNQHAALYEFTTPGGDHTNLPPYLLSTQQAPASLSENFVVVAPYVGKGKRSLYDEPRSKLLSFVKWFNTHIESQTLADGTNITINRQKVSLFGFSEGATLAVEMATTRQFLGVITASYGFAGTLPTMAMERLLGIPIWAFHSKGDDIYDIQCSDRLVSSLLSYDGGLDVFAVGDIVKYTKLLPSANDKIESGREHVRAASVASRSAEVYSWLLSLK